MTLLATMIGLWLLTLSAPATPICRILRHGLVDAPAASLSRITRGQVLLTLLLTVAVALLLWVVEEEGVRLLAMAAPDIAAWVMMFEVTTYLDIMATAVMTASAVRFRSLGAHVRALVVAPFTRRSGRERASRPTHIRPADNDDEDRPAFALAA